MFRWLAFQNNCRQIGPRQGEETGRNQSQNRMTGTERRLPAPQLFFGRELGVENEGVLGNAAFQLLEKFFQLGDAGQAKNHRRAAGKMFTNQTAIKTDAMFVGVLKNSDFRRREIVGRFGEVFGLGA